MPCRCSGFKVSQCNCKVVGAQYPWNGEFTNGVVLVAHSNSFSTVRSSTKQPNDHTLLGIVDAFYEKCASFNLRYCPNRGFRKYERNVRCILRDLLILVCFAIANIVVLSNILSKTALHFYYAIADTALWLWKYLGPKSFPSKCMRNPMFLTSYTHDFTPQNKKRHGIFY